MIQNAKLSAVWASVTEVLSRLEQMQDIQKNQQALLASISDRVVERRTEMENSLGDLTGAERLSVVSRVTGSFRREMVDVSAEARTGMLREAVRQLDEVCAIAAHYQSPTQMLMRESLGSTRRGTICQQIENSGPVELASLASFAVATRDIELGAALCSQNSSIKTAQRSFSSSELADALVGDVFSKVAKAISEIQVIAREVINADRAFLANRHMATDKIETALARRRSAAPQTSQGL